MIHRLLSTCSLFSRMAVLCVSVVALGAGCSRPAPPLGEVSVIADLAEDGWCSDGVPVAFPGLELRALGDATTWSISGPDILAGRGRRALPAGLYAVSVPPPVEVPGDRGAAALVVADAPLVNVVPSQITTVDVRSARPPCSLSLRP